MMLLRTIAGAVVAVLLIEAVMTEVEKAAPIAADRWGALWYALLFLALGFVLRRFAPTGSALWSALVAAIAYVTLGHWIARFLWSGVTAWVWLGAPPVIALATTYFFALIAIGIGAASVRLPRRTQ